MKIIFISLPSPFAEEPAMNPPLGICFISSYLKKKGFSDISLIDYSLYKEYDYHNEKTYLEKLPLDGDVYGIYCITPQYKWLYDISHYIKNNNDHARVISGGPHSTNCPEDCLIDCEVDVAVCGEGEEAMEKILNNVPLEKISGAAYLKNGLVTNNTKAFIKNLDDFPLPDRDIIDLNLYKREIQGEKAAHIVTLRGCPFNCSFCDRYSVGKNTRFRSISKVIEEVDLLRTKYGINSFVIYDDIFTLNKKRVFELCDLFKERETKWRCWSRTTTITEDMLTYMKESGLTSITFGVESGDDTVLKKSNKGSTHEQNRTALLLSKKVGVPVRCSLMYGLPGENMDSIKNTISLVEETQPEEWNLAILAPIPGSDIWNNPKKYGVSFDKIWLKEQYYLPCNRFADSGVGNIWIEIDSMNKTELYENLKYFITELNRICPRKKIQDTIQAININELNPDYMIGS